jgi:diaminohydroxyphosphoribosylaminopyrimidine deaminase / 5-amino-6-(5-phosphoribosylamino)uracil reductase
MSNIFSTEDRRFMRIALRLAKRGWGRTHPNPLVGSVIARGKTKIGEGHHAIFGGAHAEVVALEAAGSKAQGATLYVTLEPCSHQGKTPPCTQAILRAGIKRVVVAVKDPHPRARGGLDVLRDAGIDCQWGLLQDEAETQNLPFFQSLENRRPFLALKLALTLDGRIAREDGSSRWITSEKARRFVHHLRAGYQAIVVGRGTLIRDNPRLDCRWVKGQNPLKIVLDPRGTLVPTLNIFAKDRVLYFSEKPRRELPALVEQVLVSGPQNYSDYWKVILQELYMRGVISLLVEGGSTLGSFLLDSGHLDYLYAFYGPVIFGSSGLSGFPVEQAFRMDVKGTHSFGDSFMMEGRVFREAENGC